MKKVLSTVWMPVAQRFGLTRPYNFRIAIPFLFNLIATFLLIVSSGVLIASDAVTVGSWRFFFLVYITALLIIAILLSRRPLISAIISLWAVIELGLALFSAALEISVPHSSLLPEDVDRFNANPPFSYHSLLQGALIPSSRTRIHIALSEKQIVSEEITGLTRYREMNGQDILYVHNSLGQRGEEIGPADLQKDLIFFYGGSTTYDFMITQGETWVEQLNAATGNRYTMVNFGVPAYGTAEHLIQTAFYQDVLGKLPTCAVYYIGWNDLINAYRRPLDAGYADLQLLVNIDLLGVRRPALSFARFSPFFRVVSILAARRFDSIPRAPRARILKESERRDGIDAKFEHIFANNLQTILSVNTARGVRTILVAQIINSEGLAAAGRLPRSRSWMPFAGYSSILLQQRLNAIMREVSDRHGEAFIDVGMQNFHARDFLDTVHFSPEGSRKFANLLLPHLEASCRAN